MTVRNRTESVDSEAAVLVGVLLPEQEDLRNADEPLEELEGLAKSAGTSVVGSIVQRRNEPDQRWYLGSGKVEELGRLVEASGADVVIFDNNLSPGQTRNLEQSLGVKVLDRTELILDIFASRAQTHEARLAVELAQLQYSLPRLKRMWTHLSRLKAGVGMRGPGEKQLEVDRRLVEKRIKDLQNDLAVVHRRKELQVAARRDRMTVSLVGYTNAGKSTLLNRLTDSEVFAENLLFATLDTRTRRWQLPGWGPVLLSDTVGFIRDLPHDLIASFKATLEEARQADLLIHVADASNPEARHQIAAVYAVLEELEIESKDIVLALNKMDQVRDTASLRALLDRYPNAVPISAATGEGLEQLAQTVSDALSHNFADLDVEMSVSNGRLLAYLAAHGEILNKQFGEDRICVHCRIPKRFLGGLSGEDVQVRTRPPVTRVPGQVNGHPHNPEASHTSESLERQLTQKLPPTNGHSVPR